MEKEILKAASDKIEFGLIAIQKIDPNKPEAIQEIEKLKKVVKEADEVLEMIKKNVPL